MYQRAGFAPFPCAVDFQLVELATFWGKESSTAWGWLDTLEKQGLIEFKLRDQGRCGGYRVELKDPQQVLRVRRPDPQRELDLELPPETPHVLTLEQTSRQPSLDQSFSPPESDQTATSRQPPLDQSCHEPDAEKTPTSRQQELDRSSAPLTDNEDRQTDRQTDKEGKIDQGHLGAGT